MPTINFELISVFDSEYGIYEYFWINKHGIIISPYFTDKVEAEEFIRKNYFYSNNS